MDSSGAATIEAILGNHVLSLQILALFVIIVAALGVILVNRQLTLKRLRESEQAFRDLYDNIGEGVFRSTLDGRMISANPYLVRLNGFDSEAQMLREVTDIGSQWYVDPNRRAEIHARLVAEGQISGIVSEVYRYRTRERIWVEETTRLVRDRRTGEPRYYDGTVREVTETVRRLDLQRRYDQIASAISGCMFQLRMLPDGSGWMPYASAGLTALFGVTPEQAAEDPERIRSAIHPDDFAQVSQTLNRSRDTLTAWQCEHRVVVPGVPERWLFVHAFPEREADGSTLWHGFITDVTERRQSEARIQALAYFDSLTGLPNRRRILEVLGEARDDRSRRGRWNALLFIDLDQFKLLNDSKGHLAGDALLCEVAGRLRRYTDRASLVGRHGGDEFVILLQHLGRDRTAAERRVMTFAAEVAEDLALPFVIDEWRFETTASIGVAFFGEERPDPDAILKQADLAMYEAKAAGGGRIRVFEPAMQEQLEEQLTLRRELREGLERGHLTLVYQPQMDDAWGCVGAEALLRWQHPVRGELKPQAFLPLVEPAGLGALVDGFVLRTACRTLKSWQERPATRGLYLSVNITANQLGRPEFIGVIAEALQEAGVDPALLMLELTEQVMLKDVQAASCAMTKLRGMGVKLALDDFGTGYSSLTYLRQLPLDVLKIDRTFVQDLGSNNGDRAIVGTVLGFAQSLGLSVIAEGVETERNLAVLQVLGCRCFQGYLFARPMPGDDFIAFAGLAPADRRAAVGVGAA